MATSLFRSTVALVVLLGAYWVYAHTVVPFIEPPPIAIVPDDPVDDELKKSPPVDSRLLRWFKPGDWELTSNVMLENATTLLFVNEYQILEDRTRVRLWPCTIVLLGEEEPGATEEQKAERDRRAIIVRSSPERDSAVLHFDTPFDLAKGTIGKLVGGQLVGNVTIYSDQKSPGKEDDLLVHATNVELRPEQIWSAQPVYFSWGPNRGEGQRLKIDLASKRRDEGYHGLLALELTSNVKLHLESFKGDLFAGSTPAKPSAAHQPNPPVEVRCQGPFRFEFVDHVATFQNNVVVTRLNPMGPVDQLDCELLTIYFSKEPKVVDASLQAPKNAMPSGMEKMQPIRMTCFGQPVVIQVPSNQVDVRAAQVDYDIVSGAATLRDNREVILKQGTRELHGPDVFFQPDESRQLGRVLVKGAGWVRGSTPNDPAQTFEARWSRQLHFRPHERQHVMSLEGDAHVHVDGRGTIDADELHVWMWESRTSGADPGAAQKLELLPDRILSIGKVRIDSPQIVAAVSQLQAWFEYGKPALGALVPNHILAQIAPIEQGPLTPVPSPTRGEGGQGRIFVEGELLRLRARPLQGKQLELSEVFVEHDVRVREMNAAEDGQASLQITGDHLTMTQQRTNEQVVTIRGRPAHVVGRGLTLNSAALHFNRLTNAIWTDGAGDMSLQVDRDPNGQPLAQPQPLEVTWQGRLQFNGRVARFERHVQARQAQQRLDTEVLEVTLSQAIQLGGANQPSGPNNPPQGRPDVAFIACKEGALLESPTFENNVLVSVDRLQVAELTMQRATGQVTAVGPGWVKSVRLEGSSNPLGAPLGGPAQNPPPQQQSDPNKKEKGLVYVGVEFQGGLSGNLNQRQLTFEHTVRTVYGPVLDWRQEIDPDRVDPTGRTLLLTSDKLSLAQLTGSVATEKFVEMLAEGNAVVEGNTFTARAAKLKYTQSKGLLVLEGNGRSEAQLNYRAQPNSPDSKMSAGEIRFWPSSNRVEVNNAKSIDLVTPPRRP